MQSPCLSTTPDEAACLESLENPALRVRRGGTILETIPLTEMTGENPEETLLEDQEKEQCTSASKVEDPVVEEESPIKSPIKKVLTIW